MAKSFPVLYHKGKSGVLYSWKVSCDGDTITSIAGQADGMKVTTSKRVEQKNVGKKNETSLEEQAKKEAAAMWKFKLERKYSETKEEAVEELELPMLAKEFKQYSKKLEYPVDVQPKFDGVRALAKWEDGKVVLTSRSGKPWIATPHINKSLERFLPKDSVFDGELYIHGVSFQEITRLVKKQRPESVKVKYYIYDIPDDKGNSDLTWEDRRVNLEQLKEDVDKDQVINQKKDSEYSNYLKPVVTQTAANAEDVKKLHDVFVTDGYEGAIVRTYSGRYLYGYRSNDLLKVKDFDDDEFEVIGWETGVGRYEDCAVWVCKTAEGNEFKANMKTSIENKKAYLKNAKHYVGTKLTVRFFGKSEDGNPRFPVGIKFRAEEDLTNDTSS